MLLNERKLAVLLTRGMSPKEKKSTKKGSFDSLMLVKRMVLTRLEPLLEEIIRIVS